MILISMEPLFLLLDKLHMTLKQLAAQANISLATLQTLQVDMSDIMEFRPGI